MKKKKNLISSLIKPRSQAFCHTSAIKSVNQRQRVQETPLVYREAEEESIQREKKKTEAAAMKLAESRN